MRERECVCGAGGARHRPARAPSWWRCPAAPGGSPGAWPGSRGCSDWWRWPGAGVCGCVPGESSATTVNTITRLQCSVTCINVLWAVGLFILLTSVTEEPSSQGGLYQYKNIYISLLISFYVELQVYCIIALNSIDDPLRRTKISNLYSILLV